MIERSHAVRFWNILTIKLSAEMMRCRKQFGAMDRRHGDGCRLVLVALLWFAVGQGSLFAAEPWATEETPSVEATAPIDDVEKFLSLLPGHRESQPAVRSLVTRLIESQSITTSDELALALLRSDDHLVRREALEALERIEPSPTVLRQVAAIAAEDTDPLCQAQARLILAEYGGRVEPAAAVGHSPPMPRENRSSSMTYQRQPFSRSSWADDSLSQPLPDVLETSGMRSSLPSKDLVGQSPLRPASYGNTTATPLDEQFFPEVESSSNETSYLDDPSFSQPRVLDRPLTELDDIFTDGDAGQSFLWPMYGLDAPQGFAGRSSVIPIEQPEDGHFTPVTDRWRLGYSKWDRYGDGHPDGKDSPYEEGHWYDPYNLNVLKGDYPIIGQHTFLKLTGQLNSLQEYRQLPTPTSPFESTRAPNQEGFFGDPNQYFTTNFFKLTVELFQGNTSFKPIDWSIRFTPIFNFNYLDTGELGVVNADVRRGTTRFDNFLALEEYFIEAKLKDLSPDYDFASVRIGSQPFTSDFRGFIFSDINRGVRLFGTRLANRDQFNAVFFRQAEKDTNSQLNTFQDRNQYVFIANYYRQDFIFPGYTAQASVHFNHDGPQTKFDNNDFLARPDPAGVFQPHKVDAAYLGITGDGHIGRINLSNAFYWALGRDTLNPIAGKQQTINAKMFAAEASYDRDWIRFRTSIFYASGDSNPFDNTAQGFDTILDNPNFAGGQFSFWQRQQINLFGVGLVNRNSLVPDLRSSKFQGQSNFVNPGLQLFNIGMDFELTPKLRLITNANYLEFDNTKVLQAFTFQQRISRSIGYDVSIGMEYRPWLTDNVILTGGYACLIPDAGFKDLYGKTQPFATANSGHIDTDVLNQAFLTMILQY